MKMRIVLVVAGVLFAKRSTTCDCSMQMDAGRSTADKRQWMHLNYQAIACMPAIC
jgi:hypothetical protein